MVVTESKFMLIGVAVAAVALLILVKKKGAAQDVGLALGGAAVDLVGGVATGVLDGVSTAIGIPTTSETITDAGECRAFMDEYGAFAGTYGCSAPAYLSAIQPVQAVKETAGGFWDWLTTPSQSDYKPRPTTGAFDRQL